MWILWTKELKKRGFAVKRANKETLRRKVKMTERIVRREKSATHQHSRGELAGVNIWLILASCLIKALERDKNESKQQKEETGSSGFEE